MSKFISKWEGAIDKGALLFLLGLCLCRLTAHAEDMPSGRSPAVLGPGHVVESARPSRPFVSDVQAHIEEGELSQESVPEFTRQIFEHVLAHGNLGAVLLYPVAEKVEAFIRSSAHQRQSEFFKHNLYAAEQRLFYKLRLGPIDRNFTDRLFEQYLLALNSAGREAPEKRGEFLKGKGRDWVAHYLIEASNKLGPTHLLRLEIAATLRNLGYEVEVR